MVVGREEINEEQPWTVAGIRPEHRELVGVPCAVDRTSDTDRAATGDRAGGGISTGTRRAWRRGRAVQIRRHRGLVEFLEAGKMEPPTSASTHIHNPTTSKLPPNFKTP